MLIASLPSACIAVALGGQHAADFAGADAERFSAPERAMRRRCVSHTIVSPGWVMPGSARSHARCPRCALPKSNSSDAETHGVLAQLRHLRFGLGVHVTAICRWHRRAKVGVE